MKKTIAATVAVIALGAAIPLAASGGDRYGDDRGDRSGAHGTKGDRGATMRGHHGKRDGMRRGGVRVKIRMQEFIETQDGDGDGRVTQDEVDRWRASRLEAFDADGNGQLSLDEYQQLWLEAMRERMVRQFQKHDSDGDAQVTVDEFGERTAHMVMMRDRNEDGVISMDDLGRHGRRSPHGDRPMPQSGAEPQQGEPGAVPGIPPMLPNTETESEQQ